MKKLAILFLAGIMLSFSTTAQQDDPGSTRTSQILEPCIDFGIGYIPDKEYQVVTISSAVNNWYLKRFGAYAMAEMNFDTPAILIGPTVSINHFSYVYFGIDFLTSRGLFALNFKDSRKDFGVGFYIKELITLKVAYSFNAGPRAEIGLRFPLGR